VNQSSDEALISELYHAANILHEIGCLTATDGNLSVRAGDRVFITKSGLEKRNLSAESLIEISLDDAAPESVSSEWPMHQAIYKQRSEIACILHVHAPYLTTFAVTGRSPNSRILTEAHMTIGEIAFVQFQPPGTLRLGAALLDHSSTASVYILANHGAVAVGETIRSALHNLERAEFLARIEFQAAAIGGGIPLSQEQLQSLIISR